MSSVHANRSIDQIDRTPKVLITSESFGDDKSIIIIVTQHKECRSRCGRTCSNTHSDTNTSDDVTRHSRTSSGFLWITALPRTCVASPRLEFQGKRAHSEPDGVTGSVSRTRHIQINRELSQNESDPFTKPNLASHVPHFPAPVCECVSVCCRMRQLAYLFALRRFVELHTHHINHSLTVRGIVVLSFICVYLSDIYVCYMR